MHQNTNEDFTMMRVKKSTHHLLKMLNAKHGQALNEKIPLYETMDMAVKTAKIKKK